MNNRTIPQSALAFAVAAAAFGAQLQTANAGGFIEDSKANLTLRNFYINTDNRNGTNTPNKQEEWGQGFILNYTSGYTEGTVGFGVDAIGLLGVRLDSGKGTHYENSSQRGGTVFPSDSDGSAVDEFSSLGPTLKAKVSNTEFRYGTLQPKLPVVVYNDGRLLPVTFEGAQVTSTDLDNLTLVGGQLEHSRGRNSTDWRSLSIAGANGSAATSRDSNKFYYGGGDYKVNKDLTLQYYYGQLTDFYQQHFLGLQHNWAIGPGVLKTDLRAFDSSSDGKNGSASGRTDGYVSSGYYGGKVTKGEVDNRAFSGLFTYNVSGHSFGAGYQVLNGDSDFPFLNRGDGEGSTAYLITDVQIGKFQRAGERTWQVRYGYDFAKVGVPGLTFNTIYLKGDNIKTAYGDQGEWERDITLAYVIPDGTFKGLGFTWKNAALRSGLPAATTSGSASQRDQDENRLIVSYTLPLF
ncbi:OprD family porin [Pseudomonas citronellolis]|uniref:OprD family porin n=1 Tax=Pseudomonas citronellolis TaxID=53408 RepID=UPI0023E41D4C|nr:OprD family porin [Pseudomonas citronellolis]MDF3935189.1 OprD family porin [Pseudomonas citronellolis]